MIHGVVVLLVMLLTGVAAGAEPVPLTGVAAGAECPDRDRAGRCEGDAVTAAARRMARPAPAGRRSPRLHAAITRSLGRAPDRVAQAEGASGADASSPAVRMDGAGAVQVYVILTEFRPEYVSRLEALGLRVEIALPEYRLVQGWLPPDAVDAVAALDFVQQVKPPGYPTRHAAGAVTSEGDARMGAVDARAAFGVSGTGVTVGVISVGIAHLADSVASGDLPEGIQVLKAGDGGDEGTAMLEIVHDIAPGAGLAFYEPQTSADMVVAIGSLGERGARVVVDDLLFFDEPKFEDGMIAQTARRFASGGRLYVTSAGNGALTHYRAPYRRLAAANPAPGAYPALHNHAEDGEDAGNTVVIPSGCRLTVILQWNNPFGASGDDFDLVLARSDTGRSLAVSAAVQSGTQDPYERIDFVNRTPDPITAFIAVAEFELASPSGALVLDYFVYPSCRVALQYATGADSVIGHAAVEEVLSVAALDADNAAEPFSARGPGSVSFPAPAARRVPNISAVDCVTTRVGQLGFFSLPFCGTSAAAPHVAAAAALLFEANPSLSSEQARALLTDTAADLGPAGFDLTYGFGRLDARAALAGGAAPLSLGLALDRSQVGAAQRVQVSVTAANPGGGTDVDIYFGVLVPPALSTELGCPAADGVVFFADGFAATQVACLSDDPRGYAPLYRKLAVAAGLATAIPDFFSLVWPPGTAAGTYTVFIAATPPNALADGAVGPLDVRAVAAAALVASP